MNINRQGRIRHFLNMVMIFSIVFAVHLFMGYKLSLLVSEESADVSIILFIASVIVFGTTLFLITILIYVAIDSAVTAIYNYINDDNIDALIFESISNPYIEYMEEKYMPESIKKNIEKDEDLEEAYREVERFLYDA